MSEGCWSGRLTLASWASVPFVLISEVIFVIENNGYGLSTPSSEQFKCENFADKGIGYGIPAFSVDGNNILEVYNTVKKIKQQMMGKVPRE